MCRWFKYTIYFLLTTVVSARTISVRADENNLCQLVSIVDTINCCNNNVWTLEECISYALEHNIELKRSELEAETAKENLSEAKWKYAPSISAGINYSISTGRVLDETTYDFIENETVGSSSASISGNIDLFSGFRRHREVKKAKLDLKSALINIESAKFDLRANIITAYLQALCARESISEAEQIVSMLQVQAEKIKFKAESGKITDSDYLQICSRLYSAKNDVLSAVNDYDKAQLDLCQLLEIEDFSNFEISSEGITSDIVPCQSLTASEPYVDHSGLVDYHSSMSWRPEIKSAEAAVEAARINLRIARSSYWPRLTLSAGYGSSFSDARRRALQNADGTFRYEAYPFFQQYADNASSYISIGLNIPIFSGLSVRKNVRRARLKVADAEYAMITAKKNLTKEILQLEIDAKTAIDKYNVAVEQVRAAEAAAQQVISKFESGAADVIAYSTSISELITARYQLLSAKYESLFTSKLLALFFTKNI